MNDLLLRFTYHSHVIGKGGNNIKKVMEETGCHIHFPDSNRANSGELLSVLLPLPIYPLLWFLGLLR